jgi:hypothetical protein
MFVPLPRAQPPRLQVVVLHRMTPSVKAEAIYKVCLAFIFFATHVTVREGELRNSCFIRLSEKNLGAKKRGKTDFRAKDVWRSSLIHCNRFQPPVNVSMHDCVHIATVQVAAALIISPDLLLPLQRLHHPPTIPMVRVCKTQFVTRILMFSHSLTQFILGIKTSKRATSMGFLLRIRLHCRLGSSLQPSSCVRCSGMDGCKNKQ